ncbi:glycosyltransferase [Sporomusa aerivorans]|uniref:glycosyltransferase n=1 Tax=Sporomusa aerivorans TaxID=204936 RepID=UPI00352B5AB1
MVTSIHPDFDARIVKMAETMVRKGYQLDLICPWSVNEKERNQVQYKTFTRTKGRLERYKNYYQIWKLLNNADYDLYHFHDLDLLPFFALLKLVKRKPVIFDMHENYVQEMLQKAYLPTGIRPIAALAIYLILKICLGIIKNLIVVENGQEKAYNRYNPVQIRNYATIELTHQMMNNYQFREPSVIFTGSQYESNGTLLFLEIARLVHEKNKEVIFKSIDRFGGNDELRKKVKRRILEYNLQENVILLPNIMPQQIMQYLNESTVGLSPNLDTPKQRSAIPTKLFEYMAAGIPIVASDLPYNRHFVTETGCGFVAEPSIPLQYAERILWLCENQQLAENIGLKGLNAFREHYNWETESDKLVAFYQQLIVP